MDPITDEMWDALDGRNVGFQCDTPTIYSTFSIAAQRGLQCTGCGNCCRTTAVVTVSIPQIRLIAKHLGMSPKAFMKEYIKREPNSQYGYAFKAVPCPFLVDNKCTIYDLRPSVCRNYPFLSRGPDAMPDTIYIPGTCEAARDAWNRLVSAVGVE